MSTVEVDVDEYQELIEEVQSLREKAADVRPWQTTAVRLALHIEKFDPNASILRDEILQEQIEEYKKRNKHVLAREHDAEGERILAQAADGVELDPVALDSSEDAL